MSDRKEIKNDENEKKEKEGKTYESFHFVVIIASTPAFTNMTRFTIFHYSEQEQDDYMRLAMK